jgi:hypothetical protein
MSITKLYNIKGKISYNNEPIQGAEITIGLNKTVSNKNGSFTIKGEYSEVFNLLIYKSDFAQYVTIPFDSNNNIKSDIGVIELTPLSTDLNQTATQLARLPESSIKAIVASKTNFETLQQKKLNNLVNTLKFTLLPTILRLLAEFGISNAKQALNKKFNQPLTCPSPNQIAKIISKKNKLVRQLNITYKVIKTTRVTVDITLGFIIALEIIQKTTLGIIIPTPPAIPASEKTIDQQIKKYKTIVEITSILLRILEEILAEIISYLNLLDQYIQHCSPDSTQNQEIISIELTSLTTQQSQQQSPVITNVNGFEMGVETENTTNTLKRRRAIARNKQGVVMLKGEWSFSSIDQILIDELVFYIQQNNLKAE